MNRTKKTIAALLCVSFVVILFFSLFYIDSQVGHECSDEHCEICLEIAQIEASLTQLGISFFASTAMLALTYGIHFVIEPCTHDRTVTLISLKVQLNN